MLAEEDAAAWPQETVDVLDDGHGVWDLAQDVAKNDPVEAGIALNVLDKVGAKLDPPDRLGRLGRRHGLLNAAVQIDVGLHRQQIVHLLGQVLEVEARPAAQVQHIAVHLLQQLLLGDKRALLCEQRMQAAPKALLRNGFPPRAEARSGGQWPP